LPISPFSAKINFVEFNFNNELAPQAELNSMAKKCDICGRGSRKDASRSHSNIKSVKRQYINLQRKKIGGKKLKICTSCLKTLAKKK